MASMMQRMSQAQRLQQKADPQLLLTNRILQMSSLELQQTLVQELAENPALESVDEHVCSRCTIPGPQCVECPYNPARLSSYNPGERDNYRGLAPTMPDDDLDPLARVEEPPTLQAHLITQLGALGKPEDQGIGKYLIANVDNDGYLRCGADEAARMLQVSPREVERVVRLIQTFDPSGVGARTLQECLLIQARDWSPVPGPRSSVLGFGSLVEGEAPPRYVETIISDFWKELAASKWREIARKLRTSPEEIEETVRWLRTHLSPYPGQGYRPLWEKNGHRQGQAVRPDVIVAIEEDELVLEIPGESLPSIHVNPEYARLFQQIRDHPEHFSETERKHVREFLTRAQMFLKSIEDRGSILRQVAECLISEQERYFRSEREEDMLPMTQSQLSTFLRVHESTVSRAVAEKFLQLPSGRMVPISFFFDRALSHRKLVANVVASEPPDAPYSDQQIADILRREGVIIARRTVMKYREELNILSSRQRSRASA
jgi:RNA polymerase sigma-54 factor